MFKFIEGASWFRRFGYLGDGYQMVFPSDQTVTDYMNSIDDVKHWLEASKKYVFHQNGGQKLKTSEQLFLMESETLDVNDDCTVDILVITVRNEVAKVMFLQASVCPQRGVCGADTRLRDGHCCRLYASYWNAFLFTIDLNCLILYCTPTMFLFFNSLFCS